MNVEIIACSDRIVESRDSVNSAAQYNKINAFINGDANLNFCELLLDACDLNVYLYISYYDDLLSFDIRKLDTSFNDGRFSFEHNHSNADRIKRFNECFLIIERSGYKALIVCELNKFNSRHKLEFSIKLDIEKLRKCFKFLYSNKTLKNNCFFHSFERLRRIILFELMRNPNHKTFMDLFLFGDMRDNDFSMILYTMRYMEYFLIGGKNTIKYDAYKIDHNSCIFGESGVTISFDRIASAKDLFTQFKFRVTTADNFELFDCCLGNKRVKFTMTFESFKRLIDFEKCKSYINRVIDGINTSVSTKNILNKVDNYDKLNKSVYNNGNLKDKQSQSNIEHLRLERIKRKKFMIFDRICAMLSGVFTLDSWVAMQSCEYDIIDDLRFNIRIGDLDITCHTMDVQIDFENKMVMFFYCLDLNNNSLMRFYDDICKLLNKGGCFYLVLQRGCFELSIETNEFNCNVSFDDLRVLYKFQKNYDSMGICYEALNECIYYDDSVGESDEIYIINGELALSCNVNFRLLKRIINERVKYQGAKSSVQ